MKDSRLDAMYHDSQMPGQSWTNPRRTLPYDRPSEQTSVETFLDRIFKRLTREEVASQFLALLDAGVPLDTLVEVIVQSAFGEGKINSNMMFLVVPPLTVMLWRMAEAAGIQPVLSTDGKRKPLPEIMLKPSFNRANKAARAAKSSRDELKKMPKKEGLMKRPEAII